MSWRAACRVRHTQRKQMRTTLTVRSVPVEVAGVAGDAMGTRPRRTAEWQGRRANVRNGKSYDARLLPVFLTGAFSHHLRNRASVSSRDGTHVATVGRRPRHGGPSSSCAARDGSRELLPDPQFRSDTCDAHDDIGHAYLGPSHCLCVASLPSSPTKLKSSPCTVFASSLAPDTGTSCAQIKTLY